MKLKVKKVIQRDKFANTENEKYDLEIDSQNIFLQCEDRILLENNKYKEIEMKKIFIIVALVSFSIVQSQNFEKKDLMGQWLFKIEIKDAIKKLKRFKRI